MNLPAHLTVANTAHLSPPVRVCLNGQLQRLCIEAHTGEGWIERYRTNEDGDVIRRNDEFVTERVTGIVTADQGD